MMHVINLLPKLLIKKIKALEIVQNIICNSPYLIQERLGYQKFTQEDSSHVAVI